MVKKIRRYIKSRPGLVNGTLVHFLEQKLVELKASREVRNDAEFETLSDDELAVFFKSVSSETTPLPLRRAVEQAIARIQQLTLGRGP